jgi:hypothetical protein
MAQHEKPNSDTRVRVILMNGIESDAIRFSHALNRLYKDVRLPLAQIRRVEHRQQTMVNWLNPPDQSPPRTRLRARSTRGARLCAG